MKLILSIAILAIGFWSLVISTGYAVGISVSPRELVLHGAPNKKITGTFTVMNPSRETVIYEVSCDDLLPLAITPTTFLLEPSKTANITIEYQPTNKLPTDKLITTQLSILGRPLTVRATNAASGIKLPVAISTGQVAGVATARDDPSTAGVAVISVLLILIVTIIFTPSSSSNADLHPQ